MSDASLYPWNVRVDIGGVSFDGPGMDSRSEAEAIKRIVEDDSDVQNVEVCRQ